MAAAIPPVEVADDGDALRIRRPDREMRAMDALMRHHMRAEHGPEVPMRAFAHQVFVHLADDRAEAVGVVELPAVAVGSILSGDRLRHREFRRRIPKAPREWAKFYGFGGVTALSALAPGS
jgi:hypothetical protein